MQFNEQIGYAAQIIPRVGQSLFGLAPPLAVTRNTGRFLQKTTQILWSRLEDSGDHALTNNGVRARPQTGSHKQIVHITTANALVIDLVDALTVPAENPAHGKLGISGPRPTKAPTGIFE